MPNLLPRCKSVVAFQDPTPTRATRATMMADIKQAKRDAGVLMDNIKIAVRLRPTVHKYEQEGKSCIEMVQGDEDGGECTVKVRHPNKTSNTRNFSVDTCFNSYSGDASGTQVHNAPDAPRAVERVRAEWPDVRLYVHRLRPPLVPQAEERW